MTTKEKIELKEDGLHVPHLGITLRVLLSAASAASDGKCRKYPIVFNNTVVGMVRIKHYMPKESAKCSAQQTPSLLMRGGH